MSLRPPLDRRIPFLQHSWKIWLGLLFAGLGWFVGEVTIPRTGQTAERIYVAYNVLERSISIASLERYAKTGVIDDEDLAVYAQYAAPNTLKDLRAALVSKAEISPVTVAQFLYTPQGEAALKRLGQVIRPESRISGFKAIRAGLILAARSPEGLTLLSFLREFPTRGIRVDIERSLKIVGELEQLVNQTKKATSTIIQLANREQETEPFVPGEPLNLPQTGPYTYQKQTLELRDPSRQPVAEPPGQTPVPLARKGDEGRTFPVDLFLPDFKQAPRPQSVPVIVISHGLGSDRTSFAYLAQHLATHGFAVLVPEHPGSNRQQMETLLKGNAKEVADPAEFANRPLDVSYVLNYLEQQASTTPAYQDLNLKQVGIIGQSFGGYTALALAGAPISFEELKTNCRDLENTFNISLLLQCRAESIEQSGQSMTNFRDPRIQAAIAINPINSVVQGQVNLGQIKIPTMIMAGSADTVAPALFEQYRPFTWLTTPDKYLVQMDPGTHFSVIGEGEVSGALTFPPEVIGPEPETARDYVKALSLAFFKTYIANQPAFRAYLTAGYAQSISDPDIRLFLVRSLGTDQISHLKLPDAIMTKP